jgi:hypothetical protein
METNPIDLEAMASALSVAQWAIYALAAVLLVTSTLFSAHVLISARESSHKLVN